MGDNALHLLHCLSEGEWDSVLLALDTRISDLRRIGAGAKLQGKTSVVDYCLVEQDKAISLMVKIKRELMVGGANA